MLLAFIFHTTTIPLTHHFQLLLPYRSSPNHYLEPACGAPIALLLDQLIEVDVMADSEGREPFRRPLRMVM
jgi:hypothetical protein